jgi:hypothetical protein
VLYDRVGNDLFRGIIGFRQHSGNVFKLIILQVLQGIFHADVPYALEVKEALTYSTRHAQNHFSGRSRCMSFRSIDLQFRWFVRGIWWEQISKKERSAACPYKDRRGVI